MAPSESDQLSEHNIETGLTMPFTKDDRRILRRELKHLVKKNARTGEKLKKGMQEMKSLHPHEQQSLHPHEQQSQQDTLVGISHRMRNKIEKFKRRQKRVLADRAQLHRSDPSPARASDIEFMKTMLANLDEGIASMNSLKKRKGTEQSNETSILKWDSDSTSDSDNMIDDFDNHSTVDTDLGTPTKKVVRNVAPMTEVERAAKTTDADKRVSSDIKGKNDGEKKQRKKRKNSKPFSNDDVELPQAQGSTDISRKAKKHKASKSLSLQDFGMPKDPNMSQGGDSTNAASDKKPKKSKTLPVDKINKERKSAQEQLEPASSVTLDNNSVSSTVLEAAKTAEKGDEDGALNVYEIVEVPTDSNIATPNDKKKKKKKRKNKKRSHSVVNEADATALVIADTAVQTTSAPPKGNPKGPTRINPPAVPATFSDLRPRYNPFSGFLKTWSTQRAEPIFTPPEKPTANSSSSSAVESGQTWVLDTVGSRKKNNSVTMKIGKVETTHQTDQESPTPLSTKEMKKKKKKTGKPKKVKGPETSTAQPSASVSSVHASGDLVQSLHPDSHGRLAQLAAATGPVQRSAELQKKLAEDRKMIKKERDAWMKVMKF